MNSLLNSRGGKAPRGTGDPPPFFGGIGVKHLHCGRQLGFQLPNLRAEDAPYSDNTRQQHEQGERADGIGELGSSGLNVPFDGRRQGGNEEAGLGLAGL